MFINLTYPFVIVAVIVALALGINNSQMNQGYDMKLNSAWEAVNKKQVKGEYLALPKGSCLVRNTWGTVRYLDVCKKKLKSEVIIFERE